MSSPGSRYVHRGKDPRLLDGARVSVISGASVADKEGLLAALAEALGFPDYFGRNWDAFEETFRDQVDFSEKGKLVVEIEGSATLQDRIGSELSTLVSIWEDDAPELAVEGVERHLVLA